MAKIIEDYVGLSGLYLKELPNIFDDVTVNGGFFCGHNKLITLKGSPKKILGDFYCDNNRITNLEGSPEYVGGNFICSSNQRLTSIEGLPKYIGGYMYCRYNRNLKYNSREEFRKKIRSLCFVKGRIYLD